MSPKYSTVPKDIDGVLMVLDGFEERLKRLEESQKEVKAGNQELKDFLTKLDKKLWGLFVTLVVAVGAKYGLDLTGIVSS